MRIRKDGESVKDFVIRMQCEFPGMTVFAASAAEDPYSSGVQFTQRARNYARGAVEKAKRKHDEKLTIWVDKPLLEWLEKLMEHTGMNMGEVVRAILREAMGALK